MNGGARGLDDETAALLERVEKFHSQAEPTHEHYRRQFTKYYKMWRSYRGMRSKALEATSRADKDDVVQAARAGFGTPLFIPLGFGVVETVIPRMLSTEPRPQVTPRDPESEGNIDNIKLMVAAQQHDTMFSLSAQTVAKWGAVVGLGVGKTTWAVETKVSPVLEQRLVPQLDPQSGAPVMEPQPVVDPASGTFVEDPNMPGQPLIEPQPVMVPAWVPSEPREQVKYAGPRFDAVDPFDWIWDPDAYSMQTLGEQIHRQWRTDEYCKHMFETEAWKLPEGWTLEDALRGGGRSKRDEVWGDRLATAGIGQAEQREREIHEVWEYWSADKVIVVLDRHLPVASGPPGAIYWHGDAPFQLFRPTEVMHEMVGIGEIEAIEDLQLEMNEMRTQRRDNAMLVMQRPFAYFEGFLDPKDMDFSAAAFWPMSGPPSEILFPIPLQDIPFSSYRESEEMKADADRASGISDTVMGGADTGAPETATGVQMVQAAAGARIAFKTRRFEMECVTESCRQWVALDQQHVIEERVVPGPPKPGEGDREYSWYTLGPEELAGNFAIECEGGSMSPQNDVADQQEATGLYQLLGPDPLVDRRKLVVRVLEKFGIRNAEAWLLPEMPMIDPRALDLVRETLAAERGVDPGEFDALVAEAMQELEGGASDQTFGSVGDQVPQSRESAGPVVAGPPAG